ncbi:DUF4336 domain-containing protein [Sphingosinicella terrae]|uniref:DUF4336 domain-containing protein n=1 Tax=Sphingosinicella terrae TaxID=2172047 RepID=UPI000E0CD645|nr:DUF4336 domain-containing protein [Sphingosinicella terrae]
MTYDPINRLKPVTENVWIVDGPVIRFGLPWPKMPFPTRMTLLRLDGGLFVHSPTPLVDSLRREVEAIGPVRWIVGPSPIHYWWIAQWQAAFPEAEVHVAPGTPRRAGDRLPACRVIDGADGHGWDEEVATLPVRSRTFTEVEFFHRPSRTLILTDLIENFEAARLGSWWMRLLTRIGGVRDPDGRMPRDMRLTFVGRKAELRAAVDRMIGWDPERIILAHGRWYDRNGRDELERAFDWLNR